MKGDDDQDLPAYESYDDKIMHTAAVQDVQHDVPQLNLRACYGAVVICGILNNNGFCVVMAASQNLAKLFHTENWMSAFTFILLCACTLSTIINARVLIHFTAKTRILGIVITLSVSYVLLAVSTAFHNTTGFMISLVACVCAGACQTVGEVTNLAFLKTFPPTLLGAWGAGTGLSGLVGPLTYLLLSSLGVPDMAVFLALVPTSLLYLVLFRYLDNEANGIIQRSALVASEFQSNPVTEHEASGSVEISPLLLASQEGGVVHDAVSPPVAPSTREPEAAELSLDTIRSIFACSGSTISYMALVYFCEYSINPALVDRDTHHVDQSSVLQKNTYVLAGVAYNIGVTLSRTSVSWFEIKQVWLLSLLQFINMVLWAMEAYYHTLRNHLPGDTGYVAMLCWMIFVGLMGGATYSNCMNIMNKSPDIPDHLREVGVNICFTLLNLGIIVSSVLFLVLDTTVYSLERIYPGQPS